MGQLNRHGMPLEPLAVPLVESGYRNLPRAILRATGGAVDVRRAHGAYSAEMIA
jgi:hypothetical protein